MSKSPTKVPNEQLLEAGLAAAQHAGKPLTKAESKGRSMIYRTEAGQTVRVRTCNDHILIVLAESDTEGAKLNIEGTDYLMVVMPEHPRVQGPVLTYFLPTAVAVDAARSTHKEWLQGKPNTSGNRTWNLWFGDSVGPKLGGFAQKWAKYRLDAPPEPAPPSSTTRGAQPLGEVIAASKAAIAAAAAVKPEAVRISIDWS